MGVMTARQQEVIAAAMSLPPEARAPLAEQLLDSLDPARAQVDAAWALEVERRVKQIEEGRGELASDAEVIAAARRRIERLKGG